MAGLAPRLLLEQALVRLNAQSAAELELQHMQFQRAGCAPALGYRLVGPNAVRFASPSPSIENLIFSKHRLEEISLKLIVQMNLKSFIFENSNLTDELLEYLMIPFLLRLKSLDLSYNSLKLSIIDFIKIAFPFG